MNTFHLLSKTRITTNRQKKVWIQIYARLIITLSRSEYKIFRMNLTLVGVIYPNYNF